MTVWLTADLPPARTREVASVLRQGLEGEYGKVVQPRIVLMRGETETL